MIPQIIYHNALSGNNKSKILWNLSYRNRNNKNTSQVSSGEARGGEGVHSLRAPSDIKIFGAPSLCEQIWRISASF